MKITAALSVFAFASMLFPAPAWSAAAPRLHAHSLDALAPLPLPYNEKANASGDLAAARSRAKAGNKLLLVDLGGNWCADCRILSGVMDQPEMKPFVERHFEVVNVDVGLFNRNMEIPAHYGFKQIAGVPAVIIIDPTTDQVINRRHVIALADARTMSPQAIADWLAHWVP